MNKDLYDYVHFHVVIKAVVVSVKKTEEVKKIKVNGIEDHFLLGISSVKVEENAKEDDGTGTGVSCTFRIEGKPLQMVVIGIEAGNKPGIQNIEVPEKGTVVVYAGASN